MKKFKELTNAQLSKIKGGNGEVEEKNEEEQNRPAYFNDSQRQSTKDAG